MKRIFIYPDNKKHLVTPPPEKTCESMVLRFTDFWKAIKEKFARHCEKRSDEVIQKNVLDCHGDLQSSRNDRKQTRHSETWVVEY